MKRISRYFVALMVIFNLALVGFAGLRARGDWGEAFTRSGFAMAALGDDAVGAVSRAIGDSVRLARIVADVGSCTEVEAVRSVAAAVFAVAAPAQPWLVRLEVGTDPMFGDPARLRVDRRDGTVDVMVDQTCSGRVQTQVLARILPRELLSRSVASQIEAGDRITVQVDGVDVFSDEGPAPPDLWFAPVIAAALGHVGIAIPEAVSAVRVDPRGVVLVRAQRSINAVLARWETWIAIVVPGALFICVLSIAATGLILRHLARVEEQTRALAIARDQALSLARAKDDFLAGMSHELRTPLNAILGFSEVIRDRFFGSEPKSLDRYVSYSGDIHRSATHLLALIDDLLDTSRARAGRLEPMRERIAVDEALGDLMRMHASLIAKADVTTTVVVEPETIVMADRRMLLQILSNLLSNALKFTPSGGRIDLWSLRIDGGVELVVRDSGCGMPPQAIEHLFTPFAATRDPINPGYGPRGTGLGLPLVRALMDAHGGDVRIESVVGLGTTVRLRFPEIPQQATDASRALARTSPQD
jgi:signal transduction histidine kinase